MTPYQPQLRPALLPPDGPGHLREVVGMSCPVCKADMLSAVIADLVENPDGSAHGSCPNCHAQLRQNSQGFVFLRGV
jgi:hypothetical protein